ncbi:ABC transporter permease [Aureimonas leprariae]|uniref:ABC transporter permease n=1 Tax=Plantimonas leprariae TaxID=2615207 RepID=A0A7V7PKK2_9HYPH|nr:ABC transporter permease [Aureimonas leprariae]KAB0676411.1 ABC transporter permease [Aureimonas leprariae]
MAARLDRLGAAVAALALVAAGALPFASFRANRIVAGQARMIWEALPPLGAALLLAAVIAVAFVAVARTPAVLRLAASFVAVALLAVAIGLTPAHLAPPGNNYARVSPASGFWVLLFAFAILAADALTRLRPRPLARVAILALVAAGLALVLGSGLWDGLSILKEYSTRAASFWREARQHVLLAFGSLVVSTAVGVPLGILCHRVRRLRQPILGVLNAVQTIPSIALFGLLIAPLGWIALNVPGAAAAGIRGIGAAPALVALFFYSLLPVVANTVVGLGGVPRDADDAARGIGMTDRQRLFGVELPLAFPVILTGIRIVLVQNIGLATVAALIGGGGFGVFVFQGIGQTAMDLVLLGAVPTVALAFAAAVILDAAVEAITPATRRVDA